MSVKQLVPGLYMVAMGAVNAFIIDDGDGGLALIDTGFEKDAPKIEEAFRSIDRPPTDVRTILLTHAHPDHLGSAARFATPGGTVALHPDDATIARQGVLHQAMSPSPGLLNRIVFRLAIGYEPAEFPPIDSNRGLTDGEILDIAGGIEVIHTPGHTPGHVSFLWNRDRGVLIAGDAAANLFGLGYAIGYEDLSVAKTSLAALAKRDFEMAVFGHGRPITSNASSKFARKFG